MSEVEVLWRNEKSRDFLADLQAFAASLDHYQIVIDVRRSGGKRVVVVAGQYTLQDDDMPGAFGCPECGRNEFDVMEGTAAGLPVLGLACWQCETYGLLLPRGL